ncbi:MAG: DMT family transporter [Paracoccus sp. (in: a-proteobacteria)]|uniref:DMT family transporter n=1 Tax=Paracoccus sp. TaxID=267 RepID=UPI0026E0772A|nr:DMT family transporter [Paracoccus sp. (in: a-proteobacteria)]MDO5633175.1 DMT family transporter [Paracoccus sp. (in: a-proteobacteria)]
MNPVRGILMKLGSVVLFIAMAALIKATAGAVPPGQQVFFRSAFAVPVILIWLARRGELSVGLRVRDPMGHVWRGLIGTAAMGFGFAALGLLPLPEVTAIGYAAPLLVVIFAAMFLGEDVRLFRLSAVGLGLIGVLIVLSPRLTLSGDDLSATQTLGAVFALIGAIMAALAQIFIRKLVRGERTSAIVFWFSVTGALLSLTTLPFGWAVPDLRVAGLLIVAGLLGGLAQIMLTSAYRYADASLVAPFEYASMLFALVIGYAVFDELPAPAMLAGAAIIIAAGVLIIWRERRLGIARARQRKATPPQS